MRVSLEFLSKVYSLGPFVNDKEEFQLIIEESSAQSENKKKKGHSEYCALVGCSNSREHQASLSFFRCPLDSQN